MNDQLITNLYELLALIEEEQTRVIELIDQVLEDNGTDETDMGS